MLAAVSAALLLAGAATLLYEALAEPETPPQVRVAVDHIQRSGDGYLVEFTAENTGNATAASLGIEGALWRGTTVVESRTLTFDYLPAASKRKGGFFFSANPRAYTLKMQATGYARP